MSKRIISLLLVLVMALSLVACGAPAAEAPAAEAAPAELLDGCTDIPEAVALAETLQLRGIAVDRALADLERRKGEIAAAARELARNAVAGEITPDSIDEKAIEAFGDAKFGDDVDELSGCLAPADFFLAVGFKTVRPHPRSDTRTTAPPRWG